MFKGTLFCLLFSISILYGQVDTITFYIDVLRGSANNSGKSYLSPFKGFESLYLDTISNKNIVINVAPGIYSTTNVAANDQIMNANETFYSMLLIKNNKVTIRTYIPDGTLPPLPARTTSAPDPNIVDLDYAILDGGPLNLDIGIFAYPSDDSFNANNLIIEGIYFRNFKQNGIRVRGGETSFLEGVTIKNCIVTDIVGVEKRNCSAFHISLAKNLAIHNNSVWQDKNNSFQSDGFYIAGVNIITIDSNYIYLKNDNTDTTNTTDHIDGIQFSISEGFYCRDVNVHSNKINNDGSKIKTDKYRQGIYLEHVKGFANIFNNLIISKVGSGLIGIDLKSNNALVNIYNNTLHSKGNPGNLIFIKNNALSNVLSSSIKISNNIFYKPYEGSDKNYAMIYLDSLVTDEDTSNITFNNLYYCGTQGNPTIQHRYYDQSTYTLYQGNNDPKFKNLSFYIPMYSSPAKNNGKGYLANGVVNDFAGNPRPYWNKDFDIGAYEIDDAQLKIGLSVTNTQNIPDSISHTLTFLGTYWEKSNNNWIKSQDMSLRSATLTTLRNSAVNTPNDFNVETFKGWQYKWINWSDTIPNIGAGFYKLTNDHVTENFIYLDLRESPYNYSSNAYLVYTPATSSYSYYIKGSVKLKKLSMEQL